MRRVLLAAATVLLASPASSIFPPQRATGVVYDASTRSPIVGVVVTAHVQGVTDTLHPWDSFDAHQVVTVTDSLGRYSAGYLNSADVVYVAAGYDTLRLRWPQDLELPRHEPCNRSLVDVFLTRTKNAPSPNSVLQPTAPRKGHR